MIWYTVVDAQGNVSQVIKRCNGASIASVYDIMEMEDAQRNELLQMDGGQMYVLRSFVWSSVY
jgi:pre-mRNA-splicing helicase BRR2